MNPEPERIFAPFRRSGKTGGWRGRLSSPWDSAYRSAATEAKLKVRGLRSRIHQRASRNRALSKAQENANYHKSKVRGGVEHVFGAQQTSPGGRIVRTIGIMRAKAKISKQNLAYNIRRFVRLERMAAA